MTGERDQRWRELRKVVRTILWEEWDPIGLTGQEDWPEDEYDQYVLSIVGKIVNGAPASEIADYLQWASDENIGCPIPRSQTLPLALKLAGLRLAEVRP